jgi:restriction endonuclease
MKLKFKTQVYQTAAMQAVVDCFKGQPWAKRRVSCNWPGRGRW